MPAPTMLWYDYETTGADPVRDRPAQFAAQRTDLALNPVGEPVSLFCKPVVDVLPHPVAALITGIVPQATAREGVREADFAATVHDLMSEPGTCSSGYNSIRFDDEVNRNLFYRNFFDPYEHAWKNGNSRFDIMDLARACHALRPHGIAWPARDDGSPSFKLEHLSSANGLEQARAHDALCDVGATIALARLLRQRQPRLYDWHFALRDKRRVTAMLAQAIPTIEPLLHVSGRYRPTRGCLAMVAPIAEHPARTGTFIVADLSTDARGWVDLAPDAIVERLFTRRDDLPEDIQRPPLKEVHANRAPFLAPVSVLHDVDLPRIGLDVEVCERNLDRIRTSGNLPDRVRHAFAAGTDRWPEREDPECRLYAGFASPADKRRCDAVRATPAAQLGTTGFGFDDARYLELLFRYRARNWPETLQPAEYARWRAFVRDKLTCATETTTLTLADYRAEITRLRTEQPPGPPQAILDQLQAWGEAVQAEFAA